MASTPAPKSKSQRPSQKPQSREGRPVRRRRRDNTEPRGLGWYLFYALVLHFLFFGLAAFNRYLGDLNPLKEVPIDMEIGVDQPIKKQSGGGEDKDKEEPPPPPKQAKVVPQQVPIEPQPVQPEVPEIAKDLQALPTNNPVPTTAMVVPKQVPHVEQPKDVQKEQVVSTMDVKTVMQGLTGRGGSDFGSGAGRGGGNGGLGRGFGINDKELPVVQGGAVFGTNKKGFLKGTICFLPPGTQMLKNVSRCSPVGIMYANVLNVTPRRFTHGFPGVSDRFEWFMLEFRGKFEAQADGDYEFRLLSDDGSIFWIDNTLVIDNDGQHPPQAKIKSWHLTAGKHSMRLLYFQGPRTDVALQLFVKPPGGVEQLATGSF